jgi:hypothetical protein
MDVFAAIPDWLVWCAASIPGAVALALLVNTIEAALDLEA